MAWRMQITGDFPADIAGGESAKWLTINMLTQSAPCLSGQKTVNLCQFFGMNGAVFLQFGKSALSLS
jgi:hypothetical protein